MNLGPAMRAWWARKPAWLRAKVPGASDNSYRIFLRAAFLWQMGYGRLKSKRLPRDRHAEPMLTQGNRRYWHDPRHPERARDWQRATAKAWNHKLSHSGFFSGLGHALSSAVKFVGKIPVVGSIAHLAEAPFAMAVAIAKGQRIDRAALGALKSSLRSVRELAPYAKMVTSFIPGIGTGVAAAIGAATALAEGRPITSALLDAAKGALPGGEIARRGFDVARDLASGKSVVTAAVNAARAELPPAARKGFDVGLALAHGKNLQRAATGALLSLAPHQVRALVSEGAALARRVPGMREASRLLARQGVHHANGFHLATALLAHRGINEAQLSLVRRRLRAPARAGFDAALHLQRPHEPVVRRVRRSRMCVAVNMMWDC